MCVAGRVNRFRTPTFVTVTSSVDSVTDGDGEITCVFHMQIVRRPAVENLRFSLLFKPNIIQSLTVYIKTRTGMRDMKQYIHTVQVLYVKSSLL